MFLREHTVTRGEKRYTSYRLCRTVRDGDKVHQQLIAHLGKLSKKEAARIGRQLLAIGGETVPDAADAEQGPGLLYGGPLLVEALMEQAQLRALLEPLGQTRRRLDLFRTLKVALCAQLLSPGSDLRTSRWQQKLLCTQAPYAIPYQHFLRALDVLADHHPQIEAGLLARVQHLFSQTLDVVFYDLTSSYFEGAGPPGLARRGYSRDGRGDCPQIVLGIAVTKDGFQIAYRIHPGNTVDAKTVQQITADFRERLPIDRCLVVGDSGLLSRENAEKLGELGLGYLMGMRAATTASAQEAIARTHDLPPQGRLGEVTYWPAQQRACPERSRRNGKAYIVLHSPGREKKTTAILDRKLALVRPKLQQLERDVRAGKVRAEKTIAARATRILVEAKATPYIELRIAPGAFAWSEKAPKLDAIRTDAGKYVLETNELDLPAHEAAVAYRQLEVVEDSIRRLKDTLQLRPLYHRTPHRVIGHVGLCVLALFLLRLLEERLLAAGLCHPAEAALAVAQELQAVPVRIRDRQFWPPPYIPTTAAAVFRAVGILNVKERFQADLKAVGLSPDL